MKKITEIITNNINWDKVTIKTKSIIVEETDLIKVLSTINKLLGTIERISEVRDLDWPCSNKWIVSIQISNYTWKKLIKCLKIVRVWNVCDIPSEETKGIIYSYN